MRRSLRERARVPELDLAHCIGVWQQMLAVGTGRSAEMLDLVMLAIGLGFFALSIGYAMACDRL
jgi:hypothetical protein